MIKMYRNLQVWAMMLTVLFLGACSSQKIAYESLVPVSDNDLVLSLNIDRLLTKSQILEKSKGVAELEAELASSPVGEMMNLLRTDTKNSGLNLSNNLYVISVNNAEDISFVVSMIDVDKFEKFMKSSPQFASMEAAEESGFKSVDLMSGFRMLYNKDLLLITSVEDYLNYINKSEKHLTDYKYVKTLQTANDIAFVSTPKAMMELLKNPLFFDRSMSMAINNMMNSEMYANYDGMYTAMTMNFEKGEILFDQMNYTETEKAAEYLAKFAKMTSTPTNKFTKAIAKDPYFYTLAGISGKVMVEEIAPIFKNYLPAEVSEKDAEMFAKIMNLFSYINGDILFALSELNISFIGFSADMSLLVEGDAKPLYGDVRELILSNEKSLGSALVKNTDEEMVISEGGFTIYMGHKDKVFYVTSNEELAKNPTREVAENLTKSRYFAGNKQANVSLVLDFKRLMQNPMVQMGLNYLGNNIELKNFIQSLDYMASEGETGSSKCVIVLDNKEVNTLSTITQLLLNLINK